MAKILTIIFLCCLQLSCNAFNSEQYNSIVKKSCRKAPACFEKIQAAIDAAPDNSAAPYRIHIDDGSYREKVLLTKSNLQLIGDDAKKTRIVFNDYAGKEFEPGKTLSTPGSATFTVRAQDIFISNLTIENDFNFLVNDALANDNFNRISGSQAVALFIDAPSDKVLIRDSALLGNQDTLFVNSGRSWFDQVLVAGNVDYIFGKGNAVFTNAEIKTVARGKANNPHGFITAPSTNIAFEYGLTFLNCRLTRDKSVADNSAPLGRPWHPTTVFADGRYADPDAVGKSVFINTWMDSHITMDGWYSMGGTAKDGGRKNFLPEDARFFEYKSTGAGAIVNNKHRQLDAADAEKYTLEKILGDWKPSNKIF